MKGITKIDLRDSDGEVCHPAGTEVTVIEETDDFLIVEVRILDNRLASGVRYEHYTVPKDGVEVTG